ncbi:MAG: cytochrome-c peroxidase, partial [Sedimenticola sp.]
MKNSPRQSIPVASILSRCGVACLIWLALSTSAAWAVDTELHNEPITPIQQTVELDPLKVSLGQQLFHEPRLSGDNTISCASCHPISSGGMDGLPRSVGVKGRLGTINTPTIFNSGLAFVQFWDGRAATLEAQIDGPLHNPLEMDGNWDDTLSKLRKDPTYPGKFAA